MGEKHRRRDPQPGSEPLSSVDGSGPPEAPDEGGDAACWAHLICPECGALGDAVHQKGCQMAPGQTAPRH